MKTLLTVLMVALFGATISANPDSSKDYLVTKEGKVIVAKVQFGILKIRAKTDAGDLIKVDYKEVATFCKNGSTYSRKPLYNGNKNSGSVVFMKWISRRSGYSLYCYEDPLLSSKDNKRYFIFKDENIFWLEVDSRNCETIREFFCRKQ